MTFLRGGFPLSHSAGDGRPATEAEVEMAKRRVITSADFGVGSVTCNDAQFRRCLREGNGGRKR